MDTWLEAAYRADPTSPAGRIAFRRLRAAGGVPLIRCTGHGTNFNRVIAFGDEALRENFPDSGLVHRELALAYADRASSDPIPGKLSPGQRIEPRRLAIEHARAAIALERDPIARAAMWALVFRELVGNPLPLRFYCEGD